MRRFAALFAELDATRRTSRKEEALVRYFTGAPAADAAWALHHLLGRQGRRAVRTGDLRAWAAEEAGLPLWLVEECHDAVGDLAETLALLLPDEGEGQPPSLAELVLHAVLPLRELDDAERRARVVATWRRLAAPERFLYDKLLTGSFRVGVSRALLVRALAKVAGVESAVMAHRLTGRWTPSESAYRALLAGESEHEDPLRPYPFLLAHPRPASDAELGDRAEFQAEWKWDGIRAQAVARGAERILWSRGEELVNAGFPEVVEALAHLPSGTVLDGELLAWKDGAPLRFFELSRRTRRKSVGPKLRREVPVRYLAFDLLEEGGEDVRPRPLFDRRARLERLLAPLEERAGGLVAPAPIVSGPTWDDLAALQASSRERGAEGLMLKRLDAGYAVGRKRGVWWKWKVAPLSLDAVLMYAQRGHGRRASLYTDYTLGVWDGDELVPVAKAYSGLDEAEIRRVDAFVRRHVVERYGPVRVVEPRLVFELAFEGLQPSPRHKSGIALRFPRIARWREDKRPEDADTLDTVRALLESVGRTA